MDEIGIDVKSLFEHVGPGLRELESEDASEYQKILELINNVLAPYRFQLIEK